MLTDTTFWIDLIEERGRGVAGPARTFLARHRAHRLRMSIITWGELAAGVGTVAELDHTLGRIPVLALPKQVAWTASRIDRQLQEDGQRLGENDNWIAATALAWGFSLISNDRAFGRVPGLRVLPY